MFILLQNQMLSMSTFFFSLVKVDLDCTVEATYDHRLFDSHFESLRLVWRKLQTWGTSFVEMPHILGVVTIISRYWLVVLIVRSSLISVDRFTRFVPVYTHRCGRYFWLSHLLNVQLFKISCWRLQILIHDFCMNFTRNLYSSFWSK